MADVFLSYARPNAEGAARIAEALSDRGYSVWFDADLPAHRAYADVIEEQLEAASAVVVLWSGDSVGSQWVRSEANRARETGRLVQARLDDARLPMPFDQIQCADLSDAVPNVAEQPGWRTVVKSIAALAPEPIALRTERPPAGLASYHAPSRRGVLAGGLAAAGVAAAGGGWWLLRGRSSTPTVSPATRALMDQAKSAIWQNAREGQNQAIAIYRQVVDENPTFAEGWGRLSLAYAWTSHWRQSVEGEMFRSRARSAAEQALSLDDREAHAHAGMACARPYLGHWAAVVGLLRKAFSLAPKDPDISFTLAYVLALTGRNREGIHHITRSLGAGPAPGLYVYQAQMLWGAGRQEELDKVLDEASKLYPTHLGILFTRFYTAMFSGRPGKALALAADRTNWPTNVEPHEIEAVIRVAKAIDSRSSDEADAVSREWMKRAHDGAGYAENAAQFLAALGRPDEAFSVIRAYYFSEGFDCGENRFSTTQGTYTPRNDRLTYFLFQPTMAPLRPDPRFQKLMDDLRFAAYWRATGDRPDYLS